MSCNREHFWCVNNRHTNCRVSLSQHETLDPRATSHIQHPGTRHSLPSHASSLPPASNNLSQLGPSNKKLCGVGDPQVLSKRAGQINSWFARSHTVGEAFPTLEPGQVDVCTAAGRRSYEVGFCGGRQGIEVLSLAKQPQWAECIE